jgi:L-methionine (R)-S-oxide reductase
VSDVQAWLDAFLARHGAVAGSVHRARGADLELVAHRNLPPAVVETVRHVVRGKGMAGKAQVERAPFQTCDLKADPSDAVRPGARTVDGRSAVALPVLDGRGETCAVVGVAFAREGTLAPDLVRTLLADAAGLPAGPA